jgi:CRP/FNR family transcriptional regulator, cyclic AMP receptor protein
VQKGQNIMQDVQRLLKQVNLFRDLTKQQLAQVARITRLETFDQDTTVFEQGDPGNKMYIVRRGQVEIQVKDVVGRLHSVLILGEGQVFGEMALLDQGTRSASVAAVQPGAEVVSIDGADFTALCQADTAIGYIMMRNIALDLSFKIRHQNSFS